MYHRFPQVLSPYFYSLHIAKWWPSKNKLGGGGGAFESLLRIKHVLGRNLEYFLFIFLPYYRF